MLARAHSWLDRHPLVADAGLAGILLVASLVSLLGEEYDASAGEVVASVVLCAPLVVRRRAPVAAFAAVMVACGVELLLADEFLAANVAALIALYTLVAYGPPRLARAGCAVAFAGAPVFALRFDDLRDDAFVLAWLVLSVHVAFAAVLGDRRRAALRERAGVEERARLLAAELEQQATLATALERERIARELHDVVGHALAVVIAQADGGRYASRTDPDAATAALETISATARDALAETRSAVGAMRDADAPLRPQASTNELGALVERTRRAGLAVDLAEHGEPRPLAPGTSLTVYRIAQEALTNVLKHAGEGARAQVALDWAPDAVTVVVRDDGHGGAPAGPGRGLGGMRARVEPRGGTLAAGPHPDGGFEVRATIPA